MASAHPTSEFLSLDCHKDYQEIAKEIIQTLAFPEDLDNLDLTLNEVLKLLPLVEKLDYQRRNVWQAWSRSIPLILVCLSKQEAFDKSKSQKNKPSSRKNNNPWYGKFDKCPLPSLLAEVVSEESAESANMIKALLIAASRLCITDPNAQAALPYLGITCNDFRKRYIHGFPQRTVEEFKEWINTVKIPPLSFGRSSRFIPDCLGHLRTIKKAWQLLSALPSKSETPPGLFDEITNTEGNSDETSDQILPLVEKIDSDLGLDDVLTKSRSQRKTSRPFFLKLEDAFQAESEVGDIAQEPEYRKIAPQFDCDHDEPSSSLSAQALGIRYTNYRTAIDNQDLPFGWNKLNKIEVAALVKAIFEHQSAPGAAFAWLMLFTGQPLSNLVNYKIGNKLSGFDYIDPNFNWMRRIPSPPHSYSPTDKQQNLLYSNKEYICLPLPNPIPSLLLEACAGGTKLLANERPTLFQLLGVSDGEVEDQLRDFLAQVRLDRRLRITPGRIRLTLQATLMTITADRVLTHLL